MSIVDGGGKSSGLIQRVQDILLRPSPTWDVIDGEVATTKSLFTGYACILAAIPAVAGLIGGLLMLHLGLFSIVTTIVTYVLGLVAVFLLGLIIDALAPSFGGTKNPVQAMKLAVYASTPGWVAGILNLVPWIAILAFIAMLYGVYLLYLGIPKLMKSPQSQAIGYTAVAVVVALVLQIIIGVILMPLMGIAAVGSAMSAGRYASSHASGTVNIPGGGSVDLAKLEEASRKMDAASKQMQAAADGKGEAVALTSTDVLKTYLPDNVAGFARTDVSTETGSAGAMGAATAKGTYQRGDSRLFVTVTDLGSMGALTAMAGAFNVQSSKESGGSYEKIGKVDGRMTTEKYDADSKHGEYTVLVGDRFAIQAEGDNVSIGDIKTAVSAVNPARLEGLAKG